MNEKYFLIRVEGIGWGALERKAYDLQEARAEYENIKQKFHAMPCTVKLVSVKTENGEVIEKEIHKKQLAQELDIMNILNDIKSCIIRFRQACTQHAYNRDHINNINDIYHGLELIKLSETSGTERDRILYNLEEELAIRRSGKMQLKYAGKVNSHINGINGSINSAIKDLTQSIKDKKRYNESEHNIVNYIDFYNSIDLNYKEFYDVEIVDKVENILNKNKETNKDLVEIQIQA